MSSKKYAIVSAFGHQFYVREGDKIQTEFIDKDPGAEVTLSDVLFIRDGETTKVGAPTLPTAKIKATLESHGRSPKVLVFKYLRKNHAKKLYGHRQPYSILRINSIEG